MSSTNKIAPSTEAFKGYHIHNNLGLPIGEDIPQSQFVGLCEMNTLQSMEIRAHMQQYISVHVWHVYIGNGLTQYTHAYVL